MKTSYFILAASLCVTSALTIPSEKKTSKSANSEGGIPKALSHTADQNNVEKSSSRFFGGLMPSFGNQNNGLLPNPYGGYNTGGFPTYPCMNPYGYMNGPMNQGGFYPSVNPGFYGNSFGGYSTMQQQQQTSQTGSGGVASGGFQPPFRGY